MEKLRNGRFKELRASNDEVKKAVAEINGYIKKYGWENKMVRPYGYAEPLGEFMKHFDEYEKYSSGSKSLMISEINGLIENCINPWVALELEEKETISLVNGAIVTVAKSLAQDYRDCGLVREDKGVLEQIAEKQNSLSAVNKAWSLAIEKNGYVN